MNSARPRLFAAVHYDRIFQFLSINYKASKSVQKYNSNENKLFQMLVFIMSNQLMHFISILNLLISENKGILIFGRNVEILTTVRATNHHILAICCSTKSWKWFQVTQQLRTPRVLLLQLVYALWQYHNWVKYFLEEHYHFFATVVWFFNNRTARNPLENPPGSHLCGFWSKGPNRWYIHP